MRVPRLIFFLGLLASAALARHPAGNALPGSSSTFRQLETVTGEWSGAQDGHAVKVTYAMTGDGSALMETVVPLEAPASTMVTMFTVDGNRLIATHYCAAHNQPHMVADRAGDLAKGVSFRLTSITGMKTPADWHNTGLTFVLDDANHITQHWTYAYKGKAGTNTFHYTRVRP